MDRYIHFDPFTVDTEESLVLRNGKRVDTPCGKKLMPRAVAILVRMIERQEQIVRASDVQDLLDQQSDELQRKTAFTQYVSLLRRSLGGKEFKKCVHNVSKKRDPQGQGGYKFSGKVRFSGSEVGGRVPSGGPPVVPDPEDYQETTAAADARGELADHRLTLFEPKDSSTSRQLWNKLTSTPLHRALNDQEWAWIAEYFIPGKPVTDIKLIYRKTGPKYDRLLPLLAKASLRRWCANNPNAARLQREPWGLQVRLTGAQFNHREHTYEIYLAPTKFLYYVAIQQNLWKPQLRRLREYAFKNAVLGLDRGERLLLPSTFAIHMAVVSSDGFVLLRQRSSRTSLYPLVWEASLGEFMHGPFGTKFPHFTPDGRPDLFLFLKNAVTEELNYDDARIDDFRVYGFVAEYRTLGPKLVVAYSSEAPIEQLLQGAREAKDHAVNVASANLTVTDISDTLLDQRYRKFSPLSKLALLLALIQHSPGVDVVSRLESRMRENLP